MSVLFVNGLKPGPGGPATGIKNDAADLIITDQTQTYGNTGV